MARNSPSTLVAGGQIVVDGGDVDKVVVSQALAAGDLTLTLTATPVNMDVTSPHPSMCVGRGLTILVTDAAGSDLTVDLTITGVAKTGKTFVEKLRGLSDSTGTGTRYSSRRAYFQVSSIVATSLNYNAGDLIEIGEAGICISPAGTGMTSVRFINDATSTNSALIAFGGKTADTVGAGNATNFDNQVVLPIGEDRTLELAGLPTGFFSVINDTPEALGSTCTLQFEALAHASEVD